jgi:predicted metal-dependent phosphotriesterase family hydrolase
MKTIIEWKEIDFVIDEIIGELQDSGLTDDDIAFMPLDEWASMLEDKGIDPVCVDNYITNCL